MRALPGIFSSSVTADGGRRSQEPGPGPAQHAHWKVTEDEVQKVERSEGRRVGKGREGGFPRVTEPVNEVRASRVTCLL